MRRLVLALALVAACKSNRNNNSAAKVTSSSAGAAEGLKVEPPFDLTTPPPDATRRPSGLVYKTIQAAPDAPAPKQNDTVLIKYSGWRQRTGETFFSNMKEDKPMPLNLAGAAKGFVEGLQLVHKGERAMLWLPPDIGIKNQLGSNAGETLVYEVQVDDIIAAPAIPSDVSTPPSTAMATAGGTKYVTVKPGTGTEKARAWDEVTFHQTAWDATGHMFNTTEMNNKTPTKAAPSTQALPIQEVLTSMVAGERARVWVDADKVATPAMPKEKLPSGQLCYELEVIQIDKKPEPPAVPPDVAKPPADAKKTALGVFYKVLKAGKGGPKPKPTDTVKVDYSGWQTDGKMFDSSVTKGQPATFGMGGVIKGWTDGLQLMSVGDKYRFWIPEELAYKGQPSRPQGMLVFDVELLEIKPPASPDAPAGPPSGPPAHPGLSPNFPPLPPGAGPGSP